jgi:hypothetical protein
MTKSTHSHKAWTDKGGHVTQTNSVWRAMVDQGSEEGIDGSRGPHRRVMRSN